jgi:hypothetical protein
MAFIRTPDGISIELLRPAARCRLPNNQHAQDRFVVESEAAWRGDRLAQRDFIIPRRPLTLLHQPESASCS